MYLNFFEFNMERRNLGTPDSPFLVTSMRFIGYVIQYYTDQRVYRIKLLINSTWKKKCLQA